jgi:putative hydrolase of the HAD superfamily
MIITPKPNSFFVFDLDDTLYPEMAYLESAYKCIANTICPATDENIYDIMLHRYRSGDNVFDWIVSTYAANDPKITVAYLLQLYREHVPEISLNESKRHLLKSLKEKNIPVGLITDGRSITQRNKLKALGLGNYFDEIIISEEFGSKKPDERNFLYFENKYPEKEFYFIGDNTSKDFLVPIRLGWFTICLKNKGRNIHHQNFNEGKLPDLIINSFEELILRT